MNFLSQKRVIIALALSMLSLAEIIDLTIVSVALPDLMGSLGANINEISLTMTSYIVAAAIFIPLTGLVTARYGLKKVALASAIVFGVSSVFCGMSTSVGEMTLFRLLQGIGGAFLPSLAQSYIVSNFKGDERSKMMAVFSSCVVLGPILGPILGGAIVEHLNWRWIFYVNVPLCAFAYFLIQLLMDDQEPKPTKVDYTSFMFMAIGFGCLEYFLDEGNADDWFNSVTLLYVFATSILAIGFFIWRGMLGKSVVKLEIFKYRNFTISCFLMFCFMVLVIGVLAFFPTLLQQGYGYPVDTAGYITAPRGIASLAGAMVFLKLNKKFDPRYLTSCSILLLALSTYMSTQLSLNINTPLLMIIIIMQGFAMSGIFINLMQMTYTNYPAELVSDGTGVYNFFRNIGNSVGTSIASTVLTTQQQVVWHDMSEHVSKYNPLYAHVFGKLGDAKGVAVAALQIKQQAFFISNLNVFYYAFVGLLFLSIVPLFLDKPDPNSTVAVDMH